MSHVNGKRSDAAVDVQPLDIFNFFYCVGGLCDRTAFLGDQRSERAELG